MDPAVEESVWYSWLLPPDSLKDSPSRKDQVNEEEERRYRRRTIIFMEEVRERLKLKNADLDWQTLASAQYYFHYYFARHSFKRHLRFNVAIACIFLAAKVEECEEPQVRSLPHLIRFSHELFNTKAVNYQKLKLDSEEYLKIQSEILACERKLLYTVGFNLTVKKPQEYLVVQMKELLSLKIVPDNIRRDFGQISMTFLKMSLRTSICLQVLPPMMSAVCLTLAAEYFNLPKPPEDESQNEWYELMGLELDLFKSVSEQLMEPLSTENQLKGLPEFQSKLFEMGILSESKYIKSHVVHSKNKTTKTSPPPPPPTSVPSVPPPPPPPPQRAPVPSEIASESNLSDDLLAGDRETKRPRV